MILSQTAEYALRAMACLAVEPDTPQTTQQIAEATKVPAGYLSKVLQALGRAGLVNSRRGIGGGFTVARPPNEITALVVIDSVDPIRPMGECPLGNEAHKNHRCALHRQLDEATALVQEKLAAHSIADLCGSFGHPKK